MELSEPERDLSSIVDELAACTGSAMEIHGGIDVEVVAIDDRGALLKVDTLELTGGNVEVQRVC